MRYALFGLVLLIVGSAALLVACNPSPNDTGKSEPKAIELVYVEWDSEIASTNVVRVVLEEKLGYKVKLTAVSAAAMWQALGDGDVDAMVAAWLPTLHKDYLAQVQDNVENLGPNLEGTKVGLVVPAYVEVNSVAELNDNAAQFDNKIIGIDPGAGLMGQTEEAIKAYDLDLKLVEGSGATMTAALADAYRQETPIVVTGWTPHWMFGRFELKYLEDPNGVFGVEEHIATMVRKGLKDDMPDAYAFLDKFSWTAADMEAIMNENQNGADPYESAKAWVAANPEKVNAWLE